MERRPQQEGKEYSGGRRPAPPTKQGFGISLISALLHKGNSRGMIEEEMGI